MVIADYEPRIINIDALQRGSRNAQNEELDNVRDSLERTGFMILGGLVGERRSSLRGNTYCP